MSCHQYNILVREAVLSDSEAKAIDETCPVRKRRNLAPCGFAKPKKRPAWICSGKKFVKLHHGFILRRAPQQYFILFPERTPYHTHDEMVNWLGNYLSPKLSSMQLVFQLLQGLIPNLQPARQFEKQAKAQHYPVRSSLQYKRHTEPYHQETHLS